MASILETAQQAGSFKTLCAAVEAAELTEILHSDGPFTVFAPNDEAFAKLPNGTVDSLLKDIPKLKAILLYHVTMGKHMAGDVLDCDSLNTVQGESASVDQHGPKIADCQIVDTDLECDNGVIHVIDNVMMPALETIPAS